MKKLISLMICAAFLLLFSLNLSAQTEVTLQDADYELAIALPGATIKLAAANPVPLNDPIKLKHNGKCYIIRCQEGEGCDKCTLYWKDENGNGNINPKKELRCHCNGDPAKACKVQAKEVDCKD